MPLPHSSGCGSANVVGMVRNCHYALRLPVMLNQALPKAGIAPFCCVCCCRFVRTACHGCWTWQRTWKCSRCRMLAVRYEMRRDILRVQSTSYDVHTSNAQLSSHLAALRRHVGKLGVHGLCSRSTAGKMEWVLLCALASASAP
jgi:hypothetical protein